MAKAIVNGANPGGKISRNIYGHFSEHLGRCIYNGIFVGKGSPIPNTDGIRNDVIEALRRIKIPVLRWPGGCFADEYHWRDGVGPESSRKRMVNTHWGGVVEDNSFGTHEFMRLCELLGCAPYINGNLGSGTVREMSEWVEYLTFDGVSPMAELRRQNGREAPWKVPFFGVGNENWGCGGNMTAEFYADQYRRFATYVREYGENKLCRIACGPNVDDYHWTKTLMEKASKRFDALTLHYYTVPSGAWARKGSALEFSGEEYYRTLRRTLRMDELIQNHKRIMNRYDPDGRVGLIVDEWGAWYDVEPGTNPGFLYQQNTMRDALIAAVNLNIFNTHCDRVAMANLAQTVNVLQSVLLTEGEKLVLTPTYHVFDLFKHHQDATLLDSYVAAAPVGTPDALIPSLHMSASQSDDGAVTITVANLSADEGCELEISLEGLACKEATIQTLTGQAGAHNSFDAPNAVAPSAPAPVRQSGGALFAALPACSVSYIRASRG